MDTRTPSPPYGYSRECRHPLERQIRIVAEFHVHNIRPSRIAYRMGIDIALIERLIAGESHAAFFDEMVSLYRGQRRRQRIDASLELKGAARFEMQRETEREFTSEPP